MSDYFLRKALAECLSRRGHIEEARHTYVTAIQRSDLDWPEAIHDAFILFENLHGSLQTLLDAAKKVEKEQEKVARRREKAAQTQMEQYQKQLAVPLQEQPIIDANSTPADASASVSGLAANASASRSALAVAVESDPHIKR